jgi:hypothetical protein
MTFIDPKGQLVSPKILEKDCRDFAKSCRGGLAIMLDTLEPIIHVPIYELIHLRAGGGVGGVGVIGFVRDDFFRYSTVLVVL